MQPSMFVPFHVFDMLIFGPAEIAVVETNGDEVEESSPRARGAHLSMGMASEIVSSRQGRLERCWIVAGSGSKLSFQNIQYSATVAISRPCQGPTVERASQVGQGSAVLPGMSKQLCTSRRQHRYTVMSGQHVRGQRQGVNMTVSTGTRLTGQDYFRPHACFCQAWLGSEMQGY